MNKTVWKGLAAGAMAACLLATLSACGKGLTEKDAETYVKGHLSWRLRQGVHRAGGGHDRERRQRDA